MPYYCTVPRCTSMAGKAKNVSFHQFPRDEELAKLWNKILKRGKPYTKYSKVCSLHFKAEDYMITSVGKHKGQWRSLRKDAIPSQNLPSDSPTPHVRTRNTGAWLPDNVPVNIMDPRMQQQMAQAIYVQTMLAMHAAGASEHLNVKNICNGSQQANEDDIPHTSTEPPSLDIRSNGDQPDSERTSFKCSECLKCFKDPDVFILHSRVHTREKDSASGSEKENVNLNGTKQEKANPILANLLKASTSEVSKFDANVLSIENHIMAGLAVNMESYIRNMSMFPITPFHLLQQGLGEPTGSDSDQDLHDSTDSTDSLVMDEAV